MKIEPGIKTLNTNQRMQLAYSCFDTAVILTDGTVVPFQSRKGCHKSQAAKKFNERNKGSVLVRI